MYFPRRLFFISLKLILVGLVFLYLIRSNLIKLDLILFLQHAPTLLLKAAVLLFIVILLGNLKWFLLLKAQSIHLDFKSSCWIYYIGYAFNFLLPGGLTGDIIKTSYLIKAGSKKTNAILSILIDRILGMFAMMISIAILLPFFLSDLLKNSAVFTHHTDFIVLYVLLVISLSAGILALFFYVLRHKTLYRKLLSFFNKKSTLLRRFAPLIKALFLYRNSRVAILGNLFLAITLHIIIGYWLFVIGSYLLVGAELTIFSNIIANIVTQLISIIPISPGGLGIGEAAFGKTMYYLNHQIPLSYATIFLIYRIYNVVLGLPATIMFLFKKNKVILN